jgi:hypothetical protein
VSTFVVCFGLLTTRRSFSQPSTGFSADLPVRYWVGEIGHFSRGEFCPFFFKPGRTLESEREEQYVWNGTQCSATRWVDERFVICNFGYVWDIMLW